MRFTVSRILLFLFLCMMFASCATIVGGSRYKAQVLVNGGQDADILFKGSFVGRGVATISTMRKNADKFSFAVKQEGCEEQIFSYNKRTLRGWACVGTILTTITGPSLIPYGLGVDLVTGALWKPDANDPMIVKQSYKNFQYIVKYTGCKSKTQETVDVVYLKNGGRVKGRIIESDLKTQVRIETSDGSIFVFKFDEIDRVGTEEIKK